LAKPDLGTKRICLTCATKFYDLDRSPILCPKCGAPFQIAALQRARAEVVDDGDEAEVLAPVADFVPLEAVDADDPAKVAVTDDIEIEDDVIGDDDDTFLEPEEDEDDGDVADLIDGDIEEDEES